MVHHDSTDDPAEPQISSEGGKWLQLSTMLLSTEREILNPRGFRGSDHITGECGNPHSRCNYRSDQVVLQMLGHRIQLTQFALLPEAGRILWSCDLCTNTRDARTINMVVRGNGKRTCEHHRSTLGIRYQTSDMCQFYPSPWLEHSHR